jgi:hypothetical protein
MHGISVKAFILANAAFFVLAGLFVCVGAIGALMGVWLYEGAAKDVVEIAKRLELSALCVSLVLALAFFAAAFLAGYLAGRLARRGHVLNGVLACSVWTLVNIYELFQGPLFSDAGESAMILQPLAIFLSYGLPLLSAFGGAMAQHSDRRPADSRSSL